jgi:multiple sugar transport system ATP-binding protein
MSSIHIRNLKKVYPTGVVAVDGVDLDINDGEIVVLLGPTGCGKSSLLRLIAGLEPPTSGEVLFDGKDVAPLAARDRGVAMVFQEFALYPHLSVAENVGFPLMHLDEHARAARVDEVCRLLGLDEVRHRRPTQLSGGQRQRVAIARAIARPPKVFLLDQPLSSLDAGARDDVRADIVDLARDLGVATVYVTHDQAEAFYLADRIAVLRKGRIEQIGTPEQIYSDPRRLFVAAFVGSPRMNLVQAAVYAEPGIQTVLDLGTQTIELPWHDPRARPLALHHTSRITVGIRPDALTAAAAAPDALTAAAGAGAGAPSTSPGSPSTSLSGIVTMVELRGRDALVHLETGCAPTPHLLPHLEFPDAAGELSQLSVGVPRRAHGVRDRLQRLVPHQRRPEPDVIGRYAVQPAYDATRDHARHALGDLAVCVPAPQSPRVGETLEITVDLDRLYLFDSSGDRISLPTGHTVPTAASPE